MPAGLGVEYPAAACQGFSQLRVYQALGHRLAEAVATSSLRVDKFSCFGVDEAAADGLVEGEGLAGDGVRDAGTGEAGRVAGWPGSRCD